MADSLNRITATAPHGNGGMGFIVSILPILFVLASCQKMTSNHRSKQEKTASFQELLLSGRGNLHSNIGSRSRLNLFGGKTDPRETSSSYDEITGALSWISYNTDLMEDQTREQLASHCLEMIDARSGDFMLTSKEMARTKSDFTEFPNGQTIVSYYRIFDALEVRDSYLDCVYAQTETENFRLREIVNRTGGNISLQNEGEISSTFADLVDEIGADKIERMNSRQLIKRVETPEGIQYLKIDEFTILDPEDGEHYTVSMAAGSKQIVEAFPHKVSLKKYEFKASIYKFGYRQAIYQDSPLAFATITGSGAPLTLDGTGSAELAETDTSVTVTLSGPRGAVFNTAVSTTVPVSFTTSISNSSVAIPNTLPQFQAINAFLGIQTVNHFIRRQLASATASILTLPIGVGINVAGACNAFYNPNAKEISLFAAGTVNTSNCANMATINDVLYHEWGHGLDDAVGRMGGITDGAFSEGIGDIVATYLTNQPVIGRGFILNSDNGIRTTANTSRFPQDRGVPPEVHIEGQIIGGAFWDLRVALIGRYGLESGAYHAEKLFVNHLLNSDAYSESYENVLRLDDNDGNPITRSPNFCIINAAFAKHGLAVVENACDDAPEAKSVNFGLDIRVGIVGSTEKDAGKLMLSVGKETAVVKMQICKGSWQICVPADKTDIELLPAGKKGDKMIFLSASEYQPGEQQELTIIAKDAYGEIIGVKEVKLVSK